MVKYHFSLKQRVEWAASERQDVKAVKKIVRYS